MGVVVESKQCVAAAAAAAVVVETLKPGVETDVSQTFRKTGVETG